MSTEHTFSVVGMDCQACVSKIEKGVGSIEGVQSARVDLSGGKMQVVGNVRPEAIVGQLTSLGYGAKLSSSKSAIKRSASKSHSVFTARRVTLLICCALAVIVGAVIHETGGSAIVAIPLIVVGSLTAGYPVVKRSLIAAARFRFDINLLTTIAVFGAMAIGEWTEAGVIMILFAWAELLEEASVARSRRAIEELLKLAPEKAHVSRNGQFVEISATEIVVGDIVLVKPGESVPVDGPVLSGSSTLDESIISGESKPVAREVGEMVIAGSVNGMGALTIKTERAPGDTTIDRIVKLVEKARLSRAPVERMVDKFAAWYTPTMIGAAAAIAVIPPLFFGAELIPWIYKSLTLLVISCPCALVLATPVTIASALAAAARKGVLIKGGTHLETLGKLKAMALDKTGTITFGRQSVVGIHVTDGKSQDELLSIAASVESLSEHPIGASIVRSATDKGVKLLRADNYSAQSGRGATAMLDGVKIIIGNHAHFHDLGIFHENGHAMLQSAEDDSQTAVMVGSESRLYGIIALSDETRPEAGAVIEELRRLGIRPLIMLTGDNRHTGEAVGRGVAVDRVASELKPEQKVAEIVKARQEYGLLAMVGDGVNDAPALAAADVGISMGDRASDASRETADVVLLADRLDRLPWLIRHARRTRGLIIQNISLAVAVKIVFITLTFANLATLWMAVFADTGISLLVIANGMRALRTSPA